MDPGFLVWLEELYPYYYECTVQKKYTMIPGSMYSEYLEDINKKTGIELYSEYLESLRAM
jgi:hypothetical protein